MYITKYLLIISLLLLKILRADGQIINTISGIGNGNFSGDNEQAHLAALNMPAGITSDKLGNLYVSDSWNNRIRKIKASNNIIRTIAGNGLQGYNGDGGLAVDATLNRPSVAITDDSGNLYIADTYNNRIRKVDNITGLITTIAGNGIAGYNGDNLSSTLAQLNNPTDLVFDKEGNLLIADANNNRIRKVVLAEMKIYTIAGTGTAGSGGDNSLAVNATLSNPVGISTDTAGNILIVDQRNYAIRIISKLTGIITKLAGTYGLFGGGYSGDGGLAINAKLGIPTAVNCDKDNNIYIAESFNHCIRKIDRATGIISTFCGIGGWLNVGFSGDGGPASQAKLNTPTGLGFSVNNELLIADNGNHRIRKINMPCLPDTFVFTGNGNWSVTSNWQNNRTPPVVALPCHVIIILNSHGECLLNRQQVILNGGKLEVGEKKKLIVPGKLGRE